MNTPRPGDTIITADQLDALWDMQDVLIEASGTYPRMAGQATFSECWARPVPEHVGGERGTWEVLVFGQTFPESLTTTAHIRTATVLFVPGKPATPPAEDTCKHCGLHIDGSIHTEGHHRGKQRCDPEASGLPYGYNAAPVGAPCQYPCVGARDDDHTPPAEDTDVTEQADGRTVNRASAVVREVIYGGRPASSQYSESVDNLAGDIVDRLAAAGLLATAPTTTTEWGVRDDGLNDHITYARDEEDARFVAKSRGGRDYGHVVVRREVTAWTEADGV